MSRSGDAATDHAPVIQVRSLTVGLRDQPPIVRDVSLALVPGHIHGLVGESGSGKSLFCLSLLGLQPDSMTVGGAVLHAGTNVVARGEAGMRQFRASVARLVFQDPWSSMNPSLTVGTQIIESVRAAKPQSRKDAATTAIDVLQRVGITDAEARMKAYPRELSGGLLQRCAIAMALAAKPSVLICDEPTTALDATTEVRVLDLLQEIARDMGVAVLLTTHDLVLAERYCDTLAVMYRGRLVETGSPEQCLGSPFHPYTAGLSAAVPRPGVTPRRQPLMVLAASTGQGSADGCAFIGRCPHRQPVCASAHPDLVAIADEPGHRAACWLSPAQRVEVTGKVDAHG